MEASILMLALFVGILLGAIFYGGLWWTVRRIVSSKTPGIWLIGSFFLRSIIAIGGFLVVARGDWRSILACFIGFLAARIGVTRLTRAPPDTNSFFSRSTTPAHGLSSWRACATWARPCLHPTDSTRPAPP